MALQAEVHQHDVYGYGNKDVCNLLGGVSWGYNFDGFDHVAEKLEKNSFDILDQENTHEENSPTHIIMAAQLEEWAPNAAISSELEISNSNVANEFPQLDYSTSTISSSRSRSRRRSRTKKNQQEIENQRMAHIEVERNRRKQMNDYLSQLRRLMPANYVLKADQASIVGGAIDYVKELEQQMQFLGSLNHLNRSNAVGRSSSLFSEFFTFPQYSTTAMASCDNGIDMTDLMDDPFTRRNQLASADIEVTMVENHANLKVRSKRRPKQLLKMVSGLQSLSLSVLHLNVTTVDQIVLYCLSLKVEEDCNLSSVDDIAAAVNQILSRIHEEDSIHA